MLLQLHGRHLRSLGPRRSSEPFLGRISTNTKPDGLQHQRDILLVDSIEQAREGCRAVFVKQAQGKTHRHDVYELGTAMSYLDDGDIVRVVPDRGAVTVLYRRQSPYNSLLVTERCDNYCTMCSQPPKRRDDGWLVDELLEIIPWMSPETVELGITGGEPTLLGDRLLMVIETLGRHLPETAVHILSNGRGLADEHLANALAALRHPDLMFGIPLYGALPEQHDYVVQRRGAHDQTIRGILNLKRLGVRVELRFVIHADTYSNLPSFARFVTRNLLFVDHIALMGLEPMGFAHTNLEALWVDPLDYQAELIEAAEIIERARVPMSIYNHQLCVLDARLHHLARRSISDWKNCYFDLCNPCVLRPECGGFFASNTRRKSRGITPHLSHRMEETT